MIPDPQGRRGSDPYFRLQFAASPSPYPDRTRSPTAPSAPPSTRLPSTRLRTESPRFAGRRGGKCRKNKQNEEGLLIHPARPRRHPWFIDGIGDSRPPTAPARTEIPQKSMKRSPRNGHKTVRGFTIAHWWNGPNPPRDRPDDVRLFGRPPTSGPLPPPATVPSGCADVPGKAPAST